MTTIEAFTTEHAARATRVSARRIRYWDTRGILSPSLSKTLGRRTRYNRLYTFEDLVGLKAIAELRDCHDVPLQQLRNIGSWLNGRYDRPWSSLRFHVIGSGRQAEVLFRDPDEGMLVSATRRGQASFQYELEPIAREIAENVIRLRQRSADQLGKIRQHRYVISNAPVLDGTRIPTAAVWDFHQAGYSDEDILREYPRLTPVDIQSAIRFEEERRIA
jgi:uncharacterized protein (DUF433 family)